MKCLKLSDADEGKVLFSHSYNGTETHKRRSSKARKSLKILDIPKSVSLIIEPADKIHSEYCESFSFSIEDPDSYKVLVGLEKRQAMQHKFISSNKQLEQEIINYKEDLKDLLIPVSNIAYDQIEDKFDSFPLLELRKGLLRIRLMFVELSRYIIRSQPFEWFIICVIIINVIFLLIESPNYPSTEGSKHLDQVLVYIYTFECVLKIVANGLLFNSQAYLRDWWNLIDFTIVVTSWVDIAGKSSLNLKSLRTLRILRPLRGLSSIEGVRVLILSLFMSFKPLVNALIVLFIVITIFAIIGLQLWIGILRNRCLGIDSGVIGDVCGYKPCTQGQQCAHTIQNPLYGTMSFDNFFYSWLNVFQVITLEGWSQIMTYTNNVFSQITLLYFIPLILFGSMLILNLTVAVLTSSFEQALQDLMNKQISCLTIEEIIKMKRKNSIRKTIVPYDILVEDTKHKLDPSFEVEDDADEYEKNFDIDNIKTDKISIDNLNTNKFELKQQHFFAPTLAWRDSVKYIQEIQNSLQYARVFSIKAKNKNLQKLYINDKVPIVSLSFEDFRDGETEKFDIIHGAFYQDDLGLASRRQSSEIVFEKFYEFNRWKLFEFLARRHGKKNGFFLLSFSAKAFVELRKDSCFGEWSGGDISIYDYEKSQLKMQDQNSTNFSKLSQFSYYYSYLQKFCISIASSKSFNIIMSALVTLNIIALASDHYGISNKGSEALFLINSICTMAFIFEFILKLLAFNIENLIRDLMNILDLIIIILSLLDFYFSQASGFNAFRALRILRLFRIFKVFRIFRYLDSIIQLIMLLSSTISKFIYLLLLLLLLQLIFTLLGMEIYGNQFDFPEGLARCNFDSFHWAFVTIFQVLTNENWDYVFRYAMRSSAGHWSAVFLIIWIILGNFIMLNLFLGILLGAFEFDINKEQVDQNLFKSKMVIYGNLMHKRTKEVKLREKYRIKYEEREEQDYSIEDLNSPTLKETINEEYKVVNETSYAIFSLSNPFRQVLLKIVLAPKFEVLIMAVTILNMIILIWETYNVNHPNEKTRLASSILDILFTTFFLIEFLTKSIALGLWTGSGSYIKDHWNKLDLIILALSLVDIAVTSVDISIVKLLRSLRILRPLKLIRYNTSMKIVLKSLINSILSSFNVIAVISIIWLIFGILGVSLFKGKLYYCSNREINNMQDCHEAGYSWVNNIYNYDNIFEALLTLFIISTQETWPDRMYDVVDAYAAEKSAVLNYNPGAAYYIISYIFIGDFFLLNLFTIIVYTKFTQAKLEESSASYVLLTRNQLNWIEVQKLVLESKTPLIVSENSGNKLKKKALVLVSSNNFKIFMLSIILINTIQMAMVYEGSSSTYSLGLNIINDICTYIFIIEAMLKIFALGIKGYFQSHWNKFDFFVVLSSITFLITQQYFHLNIHILRFGPQLFRVFRVLRLSRIVKLFNSLKYLKDLMNVIIFSMPSALNVLCLMLIFFMMYAILGVYLFWQVRGTYLDDNWNFSNFHMAMLVLWRISTGEDYPYIMKECIDYYDSKAVVLFFISFISVTTFILMEFFVSMIIQNYKEFMENPTSAVHIFNTFVKRFKFVWMQYSRQFYGVKIKSDDLLLILKELCCDIGISEDLSTNQVKKLTLAMRICIDPKGYIYYHDLLYALMRRRYSKMIKGKSEEIVEQILKKHEAVVLKKLKKIRFQMRAKLKEVHDFHEINHGQLLMNFYYAKLFFGAWKKHYRFKKSKPHKRIINVVTRIDNTD